MFAYTIKGELNNDGSYKVTLFDVGSDECPIETVLPKARIMIDTLPDSYQDSMKPMLNVNGGFDLDVDKLVTMLAVCPDAEYGCSQCECRSSLRCRESLMREAASVIQRQKMQLEEWDKFTPFLAAHGMLESVK